MQFGLTARETEVAMLLAQGRSNVAIAKTLGISTHTARHHTQRVLAKMKVHSRAEAGASAASQIVTVTSPPRLKKYPTRFASPAAIRASWGS